MPFRLNTRILAREARREARSPLGSRSSSSLLQRGQENRPTQRRGAPVKGEALRVAASQGNLAALSRLVEKGSAVDSPDEGGYTALIKAAAIGHLGCVDFLIDNGADVNAQTKSLMTALHWVAINDHIPCAASLIRAGADTSLVNMCGETALDYAVERGTFVSYLLEHAPAFELFSEKEVEAAMKAVAAKAAEEKAAAAKASFEKAVAERSLRSAASKGDLVTLFCVVEKGVDVDAPDAVGYTALMKAAAHNHRECVDHLIAEGANVNAQTESLMTALQLTVVFNNNSLCIESLLKAGADTSLKDEDGHTALDYAKQNDNADAARLLEKMAGDADGIGEDAGEKSQVMQLQEAQDERKSFTSSTSGSSSTGPGAQLVQELEQEEDRDELRVVEVDGSSPDT
mmetsp:Transcript_18506/g.37684  ORF Transcript_18506/g.37684 Transcript_18506/m.37684 type:complete len:401 (+) Transcript_18506:29-1231(+)